MLTQAPVVFCAACGRLRWHACCPANGHSSAPWALTAAVAEVVAGAAGAGAAAAAAVVAEVSKLLLLIQYPAANDFIAAGADHLASAPRSPESTMRFLRPNGSPNPL